MSVLGRTSKAILRISRHSCIIARPAATHLSAAKFPCTQLLRLPCIASMSSTAAAAAAAAPAPKQEWLIILPDIPDAQEKRLQVRSQHLQAIVPRKAKFYTMGGAFFHEAPAEGQAPKFAGSVVLAQGSLEDVTEDLKQDIYTTAGVWDWSKAQILPFKSAFVGSD